MLKFKCLKFSFRFTNLPSYSNHLTCSVCSNIFNKPTCTNCQHVFCKDCIIKVMQSKNPTCPICRQIIIYLDNDVIITSIINDLQVFCSNHCCSWKGIRIKLEDHLKQCDFDEKKITI